MFLLSDYHQIPPSLLSLKKMYAILGLEGAYIKFPNIKFKKMNVMNHPADMLYGVVERSMVRFMCYVQEQKRDHEQTLKADWEEQQQEG